MPPSAVLNSLCQACAETKIKRVTHYRLKILDFSRAFFNSSRNSCKRVLSNIDLPGPECLGGGELPETRFTGLTTDCFFYCHEARWC